jgi:hypothetical protein
MGFCCSEPVEDLSENIKHAPTANNKVFMENNLDSSESPKEGPVLEDLDPDEIA